MLSLSLLLVLVVVCALAFDYINGFYDAANAIATVVSTQVVITVASGLVDTGKLGTFPFFPRQTLQ